MRQVDTLLAVQEVDTVIDQLRHRRDHMAPKGELADVMARLAALAAERVGVAAERDRLATLQSGLEADVVAAESRIAEIDKRLYSGTVTAARDLQSMSEEVDHLKGRRSALEDRQLEIMEEREPVDAALDALDEQVASLEAQASRLRAVVAETESDIDAELAERMAERADLASGVGPELTARYERLRAKLGGVGAARVVGGSCSGCHLTLAATELDQIKKLGPDDVATCEQCGRILVP